MIESLKFFVAILVCVLLVCVGANAQVSVGDSFTQSQIDAQDFSDLNFSKVLVKKEVVNNWLVFDYKFLSIEPTWFLTGSKGKEVVVKEFVAVYKPLKLKYSGVVLSKCLKKFSREYCVKSASDYLKTKINSVYVKERKLLASYQSPSKTVSDLLSID